MSRGLGKIQREVLAELGRREYARAAASWDDNIRWRWDGSPVWGTRTSDLAYEIFGDYTTEGQMSSVRRAVRGLADRGLVTVRPCGTGLATWHEVRLSPGGG